MKRKVVSLLFAAAMTGSLLAGCGTSGSSSDGDNDVAIEFITEVEEPEEVAGYFEENNIVVEGAGVTKKGQVKEFTYLSSIKTTDKEGKVLDMEYIGGIGIYEEVNGDTKTITAQIEPEWEIKEWTEEIGDHYTFHIYGFVDRYTGICYVDDKNLTPKTTISVDDKEYELSFNFNQENKIITVTCPSNYDGAAFFVCGAYEDMEKEFAEKVDKFISISEIDCGKYDMKFFAN